MHLIEPTIHIVLVVAALAAWILLVRKLERKR